MCQTIQKLLVVNAMKIKNNDSIQFEDRYEIVNIIKALENTTEKQEDSVKTLIKLLDKIVMNW